MNKNLNDFLEILNSEEESFLQAHISNGETVKLKPLSFKQQKKLLTSGLDKISGILNFIKNLNEIILENSDTDNIKIYNRVPILLALRKELSSKNLEKDGVEVSVDELISNHKDFDLDENETIDLSTYSINLRVPTLEEENLILKDCIENLEKTQDSDTIGSLAIILSYEIPKFIESITYGEKIIYIKDLSSTDRQKVVDNLSANVTNQITEFISRIRNYDESLLKHGNVVFDIDSSFFE